MRDPLQRLRELPILGHEQVLDVVADAARAVLSEAGAPDEAAEERGQQPGRLVTEHLDDVRVRLEELVRCVVVLAAVRPEG